MVRNTDLRLSVLNQNPNRISGPPLLHHLLAGNDGTSIAIDFAESVGQNVQISYSSLEVLSTALAAKLKRLLLNAGISDKQQHIIPVLLPQSPELYVALLAILKVGAAFCPLQVDSPEERLKFILKDVSAITVVTSSALRQIIPASSACIACLVDGCLDESNLSTDFIEPDISPRDSAYVMYTSGSTGIPKAVVISHSAATQSLLAHSLVIPKFMRFLQFAAPTFDISIFEIFFTFFRGSTLVCCNRGELLDNLPEIINRLNIDGVELTPTVAGSLLARRSSVPKLKLLLTIGEMLTRHVIEEFGHKHQAPGILYGMYGPTEAAMHCTFQPEFKASGSVNLIGRPLDTVSAFVIRPSPDGATTNYIEILPYGETGELAIGGHQLADGYLNRLDQTAAVFISTEQGTLYRTGDKACFLPDGTIMCYGRLGTGQVKLRGQRLELGEVEQAVMRNSLCRMAIAMMIKNVLVVFCLTESLDLTTESVLAVCRDWLPSSQLPGDIVFLQSFPSLPSGKIDKSRLESDYENAQNKIFDSENQKMNDTDRKLCLIAENILGRPIRISSNFAASGLDSLLAIRFASEVRKQGINITALQVLKVSCIRDLLRAIKHDMSQSSLDKDISGEFTAFRNEVISLPTIRPYSKKIADVHPCTPLQNAMLSETLLNPLAYCNWVEFEFGSQTSVESVHNTIKKILSRNNILRSGFYPLRDKLHPWAQIIWKEFDLDIQQVERFDYDTDFNQDSLLHPLRIETRMANNCLRVLMRLHHALYDGWSMELILEDMNKYVNGEDAKLRPQFREVVEYYEKVQGSEELAIARRFWTEQMNGFEFSPFPNLSGHKKRPPALTELTCAFQLDRSTLSTRANHQKIHPQSIFQAALVYLLSFYIGASDVVIGSVISGRTVPVTGIDEVIGPCVATIPLRAQAHSCMTVEQLLQNIHNAGRESLQHSILSLREIKAICGINPGQPLFDVLFVWQETLNTSKVAANNVLIVNSADYLEFKLVIECEPCTGGIMIKARYDQSWIPNAQIELFFGQLKGVVTCLLDAPSMVLRDCAAKLQQNLLSIENLNPQSLEWNHSLASYVETHAQSSPEELAITIGTIVNGTMMETEVATYYQLNERANRLANFIVAQRTGPDALIGIFMEKTIDLYISILAVLKAGSGYLPLTTDTPPGRVATVFEDAGIKTCLVLHHSPTFTKNLPGITTFEIDKLNVSAYSTANPRLNIAASDLAYAIYTSGSTGKPKGVLITQANLISNIKALSKIYSTSRNSRFLQACSQAFDVSAFEIFFAWYCGICLCAASNDELFRDFEDAIRRLKITHLSLTPTVAALIDPENIPDTVFLVTAGEPLTENVRRKWKHRQLFNGYGPAETTNICSVKQMTDSTQVLNNVGRPFKNTSAFVVSEDDSDSLSLVPKGGLGELCFGGYQVFKGYVNRPELNLRKLVNHLQFGRIYRSGDSGRLLHDGSILVTGRMDDQVKIRGQRVELGEIISLIMRSPIVANCTVQVLSLRQQQCIVAFWVPAGGDSPDIELWRIDSMRNTEAIRDLYNELQASLPSYMIPSLLIPVRNLPVTSQGKIDKNALASVVNELNRESLGRFSIYGFHDSDNSGNWTSLEHDIGSSLMKTLSLGIVDIKRTTSFYSLGLDSINAIVLAQNLRQSANVEVDISTILRNPTISQLADRIPRLKQKQQSPFANLQSLNDLLEEKAKLQIKESFAARSLIVEKIRPCTPLQEGMLSLASLDPNLTSYNLTVLKLSVDLETFRNAWATMIQRHEILRTSFVPMSDRRFSYAQVILSDFEVPMRLADESEGIACERLSSQEKLLARSDRNLPPWSMIALCNPDSLQISISMHHALYDGVSMRQIFHEVERLVFKHPLNHPIRPDEFLGRALQPNLDEADVYWENLLKDFKPKSFPMSKDKLSANSQSRPEAEFWTKSKNLDIPLSKLEFAARSASLTLLSLCQAAWAKTLSQILDTAEVCFGSVFSGRTLPLDGIATLVFPCFNTLPVRTSVSRKESNNELGSKLNTQNAESLQHQFTPLRRIQSRWRRGNEQLFDSLFILQNSKPNFDRRVWTLVEERGYMGFPNVCELVPDREMDELGVNLHLMSNALSEEHADAVLRVLDAAFMACVEKPHQQAAYSEPSLHTSLVMLQQLQANVDPALARQTSSLLPEIALEAGESLTLLLRQVFSTLSGISERQISTNRTIFQLGMDSINAIQIARTLREKDIIVSGTDILENPTVSRLASKILNTRRRSNRSCWAFDFSEFDCKYRSRICEQNLIPESQIEKIRPCTPVQAGMIAQFFHSGGSSYFNHIIWKVEKTADIQQLLSAWETVFERHQILRTGFASIDDQNHSFAMLHYLAINARFPLLDADTGSVSNEPKTGTNHKYGLGSFSNPMDILRGLRDDLAQDVMRSLHQPAWRLSLSQDSHDVYLQLSIHHALYDAESLDLLLEEVKLIYSGFEPPEPIPIEPTLNKMLEPLYNPADHQVYWKEILEDVEIANFPCLTSIRVGQMRSDRATFCCSIPKVELQIASQSFGITIQVLFQAAWARVLSAYVGEEHVMFGTALSGRHSEHMYHVAFPCSSTVPVSCRNVSDKKKLMENLMDINTSILRHQYMPLKHMGRLLDHTESSLFDNLFVYQGLENKSLSDFPWLLVNETSLTEYPISIEIEAFGQFYFHMALNFREDIIPHHQAEILLKQVDSAVKELVLFISPEDREPFRWDANLVSRVPPESPSISSNIKLLHEFVEVNAETYPSRVALEFVKDFNGPASSRFWTYSDLNEMGNRVANTILSHKINPGSLIAICFDKCPEASFAILGILKSGCGFVALDHTSPVARQSFVAQDSDAQLILTTGFFAKTLQGHVLIPILNIEGMRNVSSESRSPKIASKITDKDTSYCLYTSGSTGTPKGCLISHENAVQAILSFQRLFADHWDPESRWLQFASFHFDVSVLEQFWSWSVGICVVSAPRDLIFEDLARSLQRLEVTHIDLTPSLARLITPEDVPSLCKGVFITGGEQLKQEILDAWGSKAVIYNGYGPTECTIGVTMYPRVPSHGKPSNIGWQFDNVGTYVLKPGTTDIVLRGAVGELCISGKLVGKGYLNRSSLTKERFPYIEAFHEKIYRTGDLVRLLHDDSFEFLGRIDDQVKLRGQRLEIGEISNVILNIPSVSDAAAAVLKHPETKKDVLVAFLVRNDAGRDATGLDTSSQASNLLKEVLKRCTTRLPGYMIPNYIVPLCSIPLTVNNKADSKKLPQLFEDYLSSGLANTEKSADAFVTQTSAQTKEVIAKVLADHLSVRLDDISMGSNIFQLGLDSISVFNFVKSLKRVGFLKAQPIVVMQSRTVGDLVNALGTQNSTAHGDHITTIMAEQKIAACKHRYRKVAAQYLGVPIDSIDDVAPCTPLQQGIIARSIINRKSLYFNAIRFELPAGINIDRLKSAWMEVFQAINMLRTRFIPVEEGYIQAAIKRTEIPWIDKLGADDTGGGNVLVKSYHQWCQINQDAVSRPFEVVIARHNNKCVMAVHLFHALYDAMSLDQLFQTVVKRYHDSGHAFKIPSFYSALPHGPLHEPTGAKEFWKNYMENAPLRNVAIHTTDEDEEMCFATLALSVMPNLERIRRQLNVTNQALVQTCWMVVLQNFIGNLVTTGMVVSGRSLNFDGVEKIIGPMFNTLPFHLPLQPQDTWEELIHKCHAFNISALSFQHTSLHDIMKWIGLKNNQTLFYTLFVFQKADFNSSENLDIFKKRLDDQIIADYPLSFEAEHRADDTLALKVVTWRQFANEAGCTSLLGQFEELMALVLSNPQRSIRDSIRQDFSIETPSVESSASDITASNTVNEAEKRELEQAEIHIIDEITTLVGNQALKVNINTSIFEIGLDSIDAIKLSSRLKKIGLLLPVSSIMQNPIVSAMAALTQPDNPETSNENTSDRFRGLQRQLQEYVFANQTFREPGIVLPATPLQEAIVAEMIKSNYCHYFNHDLIEISHGVDINTMKKSWETVFEHSPILRTCFVEIDSPEIDCSFAQIVNKAVAFEIKSVNVVSTEEIESFLLQMKQDFATGVANSPPFCVRHFKTQDADYFLFAISHALYDGWSLDLLHQDVHDAYYGRYTPRPSYESQLGKILDGFGFDAESFWRNYLADAGGCLFPCRSTGGTMTRLHHRDTTCSLTLKEVEKFCQAQKTTIQALAQTCWVYVLSSRSHSLDVVFGVVLSGRDDEEAQKLLFPTMNTVALRSMIHGTRADMVRYMQGNSAELKQYQNFPLRKAQRMAGTASGELFNTLFIYQHRPEKKERGSALYQSIKSTSAVEYPVCIEIEVMDNQLIWRVACRDDALSEIGTIKLLEDLNSVLNLIVKNSDAPSIELKAEKVSVCGLEGFMMEESPVFYGYKVNGSLQTTNHPELSSDYDRSLKKVLSMVSKVPEENISKSQNIFHLGLDSISAIKVSAILRKNGLRLTVGEMLKTPNIGRLAKLLQPLEDATLAAVVDNEAVITAQMDHLNVDEVLMNAGIQQRSVEKVLPATSGQVYFLSTWQNSQGALFHSEFKYHLKGFIGILEVAAAWKSLVKQEPILRTTFAATGDQGIPIIQIILRVADDSSNPVILDEERESTGFAKVNPETPLVQLYARKNRNGIVLRIRLLHSLYDGVSLPLLMSRLENLANLNTLVEHPKTTIAAFVAPGILSEAKQRRKEFWVTYLDGLNIQRPETKHTIPFTPRIEHFQSGVVLYMRKLESLAQTQGLTFPALFLAIFAPVYVRLRNISTDEDFVIGMYLANRSHPIEGITELASPTVNIVPLRIRTPLIMDPLSIASKIQDDLRKISDAGNSVVALFEITEWTGIEIDCTVNFIKLPDSDERDRFDHVNGTEEARCTIRPYSSDNADEKTDSAPGEVGKIVCSMSLNENEARNCYKPTIDFEVAGKNDAIDLGIFAPAAMLSLENARSVLQELKTGLLGLLDGNSDVK